ncbi:hypothetical protein EYF80_067579 [Liparis tanakae]|uniref:Uncharacterized protein n=1 Tax=Liparis tanakae TaxID=230148 RepID=A0A4Z2E0R4_9TELE|nr:hypothetical protein EYF80_067579 [Liparis tanakae]
MCRFSLVSLASRRPLRNQSVVIAPVFTDAVLILRRRRGDRVLTARRRSGTSRPDGILPLDSEASFFAWFPIFDPL